MFFSKKAFETHLIVLLGISFIMALFLYFFFGAVYANDSEKCHTLEFEYTKICKSGGEILFEIENTGNSLVRMEVNGFLKESYEIPPNTQNSFEVSYSGVEEMISVPVVTEGVETSQCRSKLKKTKLRDIRRC